MAVVTSIGEQFRGSAADALGCAGNHGYWLVDHDSPRVVSRCRAIGTCSVRKRVYPRGLMPESRFSTAVFGPSLPYPLH